MLSLSTQALIRETLHLLGYRPGELVDDFETVVEAVLNDEVPSGLPYATEENYVEAHAERERWLAAQRHVPRPAPVQAMEDLAASGVGHAVATGTRTGRFSCAKPNLSTLPTSEVHSYDPSC